MMRALPSLVFLLLALVTQKPWAQTFPDDRFKVRVQLRGETEPLRGGQELAALLAQTPDHHAVYDLPLPVLKRNASYQLLVTITDPSGVTKDYTGSPRLTYETFSCLTVTSRGVLAVTPITGALCSLPDNPQLWVILTDASGQPIAMNQILFAVSDEK
jgi:hypothetical protein